MSKVNLGRVQGGGIFYSTAGSGASIARNTLYPQGLIPLVGDTVLFSNGDFRTITSSNSSTVTCGDVVANIRGNELRTRAANNSKIGIEISQNGQTGQSFIDFHTDLDTENDYDSRIIASGKNIDIDAELLTLNGRAVLNNQLEELSYSLNTEYFEDTSTAGGSGKNSGIWRLFGTDIYIINANLTVKKAINKSTGSVWVFNQFSACGKVSFQGIWKRSSHYIIAGSRINKGGNAFWLDPFDDMPTVQNTTLQSTLVFYGYTV